MATADTATGTAPVSTPAKGTADGAADGANGAGPGAEPSTAPTAETGQPVEVDNQGDPCGPDRPEGWRRIVDRSEWRFLAILITVGVVLFGMAIRLRMLHGSPAGDEPAYLVITQTLQKYHSVNVLLDYSHGDYRSFYPATLEPHVVTAANGHAEPLHNIGGPLLWLIPFMLLGRLGVLGFVAVVSLLTVLNTYYFLRERGIDPTPAFLVCLVLIAASPVYTYAAMAFVEPIGALLILYALRVLLARRLTPGRLTVAAVGLGVLPWVHSRFLMFTLLIGGLFVIRIWRENRLALRRYLPVLLPIVLSLVLNEVYNLVLWGTLNPASNMSNAGNGPFQVSPAVGLIGTLFDRQVGLITNYPLFLLVLPGILLSLSRTRLWTHGVLAVVVLPYLLLICTFSAWWAGYSPPARYIAVVLPPLAYYIAVVVQRLNSVLLTCAVIAAGMGTYALSLASDIFPNDRFANYGNHNAGMDRLSHLFGVNVVRHIPSAFEPHQHPLFLTWLAATTAIGLVIWLWGLRRPALAAPSVVN